MQMTSYPSVEKPNHLHYLREFRVEACAQFKQHQCQQHRPYTCFNWHFANQRRRRPVRKPDGSFNYSADIYCDKYDENTGICPDGDSCAFLHRVAGDVERKYHLRYYKTALCVHPTDARGICTKNGAHCAFAHSAQDLRQPLYDAQEVQNGSLLDPENRDRTSFVVEDHQWHDQVHVLSCYKTEQCRKPARLCRQGYACPFYHNAKDRRRPPALYKYRSTPCPAAKSVDEWLEPEQCENGDDCGYCHTRTEQQFHPEIYKSTKCNDMLEHGYCPRAVFCAFAHHDSELHVQRIPYHRSGDAKSVPIPLRKSSIADSNVSPRSRAESICATQSPAISSVGTAPTYSAVLKNRQSLMKNTPSHSIDESASSGYPKAPGYERMQLSPQCANESAIGRIRTSSLNMGQLDLGFSVGGESLVSSLPTYSALSTMSRSIGETSLRALPSAIDELSLDELSSSALSPISERKEHKLLSDLFSNTPISSSSSPMQIPGSGSPFGSSPLTSLGESTLLHRKSVTESPQPLLPLKSVPAAFVAMVSSDAAKNELVLQQSDLMSREELQRELAKKSEELLAHHQKLAAWEEGLKQARQACEAWKRDAEYHRRIAEQAEAEKVKACYERDQALVQLELLRRELRVTANGRASSPFELPHFSSVGSFTAFVRADGDQQNGGGGPVCARCGREKRADSRNTSCRLCCS
uniref:C3H1-type domain-containing protein n=3 Tax=Parascaris univalens TaxID=6257 RepID=A0A915C9Z0_PARUN